MFFGIAAGILIFVLIFIYVNTSLDGNTYEICSQFSLGGGDYRQTVMNVLVSWKARPEEIADEIIREYLRVNGKDSSDKVILRLYRSKSTMKHGKYYKELVCENNSEKGMN